MLCVLLSLDMWIQLQNFIQDKDVFSLKLAYIYLYFKSLGCTYTEVECILLYGVNVLII